MNLRSSMWRRARCYSGRGLLLLLMLSSSVATAAVDPVASLEAPGDRTITRHKRTYTLVTNHDLGELTGAFAYKRESYLGKRIAAAVIIADDPMFASGSKEFSDAGYFAGPAFENELTFEKIFSDPMDYLRGMASVSTFVRVRNHRVNAYLHAQCATPSLVGKVLGQGCLVFVFGRLKRGGPTYQTLTGPAVRPMTYIDVESIVVVERDSKRFAEMLKRGYSEIETVTNFANKLRKLTPIDAE